MRPLCRTPQTKNAKKPCPSEPKGQLNDGERRASLPLRLSSVSEDSHYESACIREEKRAERLAVDLLRILRSKLSTSTQTVVLNEVVLSTGAVDRSLLHRCGNVASVADSFMKIDLQVQAA